MIDQRLLTAAIRTLGPEEGREWDFLGAACQAGTANGIDISCFLLRDGAIRIFEPDEESRFLLADAILVQREAMFEELGAPRFRHCLVLMRGSDEKAVTHFSYAPDPDWGDVLAQDDESAERIARAFDWRNPDDPDS